MKLRQSALAVTSHPTAKEDRPNENGAFSRATLHGSQQRPVHKPLHARPRLKILGAVFAVILFSTLAPLLRPANVEGARLHALPRVVDADSRLGFCNVIPDALMPGPVPWGRLAADAGARSNRWEFRWDRIEHTRGVLRWSLLDAAVNSSLAAHIRVLGILIATPKWASPTPWAAGNSVPDGLYLPIQSPHNLWAQYVRMTVRHFKGRVHAWEVWNEPDLREFWHGSPRDYARLLKVAYLVAHRVDPTIRIVMGGMADETMSFFRAVLTDIRRNPVAARHHDFFDVAAWHAYNTPFVNYYDIERFRSYLRAAGMPRPVWITETGRPADPPGGEQEQAAYTLESIGTALAAGASRVFAFRFSDYNQSPHWGVLQNDQQPRLAYLAFQMAARYFAHLYRASLSSDGNVARLTFFGPHLAVALLWDDVDAATRVPFMLGAGHVQLISVNGTVEQHPGLHPSGSLAIGRFAPVLIVDHGDRR